MSSIYDALQRIQSQKACVSPGVLSEGNPSHKKVFWLVLIAIIISSAGTAAVFYGIWTLKDDNGETETVSAQKGSPAGIEVDTARQRVGPPISSRGPAGEIRQDLKDAGDVPEKVEAYLTIGGKYYESGEYDKALLTYEKALRYYGDDARILNNIGSVLLAKGETEEALGYFVQSNSLSGDFVEPVYNMACLYARMDNQPEAISALKKAYMLDKNVRLWAVQDPDLENLRGNREFDEIIHAQ